MLNTLTAGLPKIVSNILKLDEDDAMSTLATLIPIHKQHYAGICVTSMRRHFHCCFLSFSISTFECEFSSSKIFKKKENKEQQG